MVVKLYNDLPTLPDFIDGGGFSGLSMVRLYTGDNTAIINTKILDPQAYPRKLVGTDFHLATCNRTGDYDFTLIGLVALPFITDRHSPGALTEAARTKLLNTMLTEKGPGHYHSFSLGICGTREDTENHILMTEVSRYLTNDLISAELAKTGRYNADYDNAHTGFNPWMINHLKQFLKNDFSEFNSKPYQGYTVNAIQTLHNHATNPEVKLTAQMVLDYLSAKFVIQSVGGLRSVPFRRQPGYRDEDDLLKDDGEAGRHMMLIGNYAALAQRPEPYTAPYAGGFMFTTLIGDYRVPDLLLDLVFNKGIKPILQRFKHEGVEVYSASRNYTIAAGGVYMDYPDYTTGELDAWAVPTTVVPLKGPLMRNQMVRIMGHRDNNMRNNTCVYKNFACGINPIIPASIPAGCIKKAGNWTFLNFNTSACPLNYGFYVAQYSKVCDSDFCKTHSTPGPQNFGFFEVAEASAVNSFDEFTAAVLSRNGSRNYQPESVSNYTTAGGDSIDFIAAIDRLDLWPIVAVNHVAQVRDFRQWPLAQGDMMAAGHDGKVTITNPVTRDRLVLDLTDVNHPQRTFTAGSANLQQGLPQEVVPVIPALKLQQKFIKRLDQNVFGPRDYNWL